MILKGDKPLIDVIHYLVGNYRYYFYYGGKYSEKYPLIAKLRKMVLRKYIKDQIGWRIKIMDEVCYHQGSCKICGCEVTALQMSNKPCDKPCYPPMMNKEDWYKFKRTGKFINTKNNDVWVLNTFTKKMSHFVYDKITNNYNIITFYVYEN